MNAINVYAPKPIKETYNYSKQFRFQAAQIKSWPQSEENEKLFEINKN